MWKNRICIDIGMGSAAIERLDLIKAAPSLTGMDDTTERGKA